MQNGIVGMIPAMPFCNLRYNGSTKIFYRIKEVLRMRFIGGKSNLLPDIQNAINRPIVNVRTIINIFSGSGVVSSYLKQNNYNVIGNDMMYFSYVLSRGNTALNHFPVFGNLGIGNPIEYLNNLTIENTDIALADCYIYQHYSPHDDCNRMYFQNENGMRSTALNPNKWWENFDLGVTEYTFLFINSYLKGGFEKQLEYISMANSGIKGAAIGVESLLYFAEGLKSHKYSPADFYNSFDNKEMVFT